MRVFSKASAAACTAASTSVMEASWNVGSKGAAVAGLIALKTAPPLAPVRPAIRLFPVRLMEMAGGRSGDRVAECADGRDGDADLIASL